MYSQKALNNGVLNPQHSTGRKQEDKKATSQLCICATFYKEGRMTQGGAESHR